MKRLEPAHRLLRIDLEMHTRLAAPPASPFADVLCAVDGSRGSAGALRQAQAISGGEAAVRCTTVGGGAAPLRDRSRVADSLLAQSSGAGLLAIGCHGGSRPAGMMLGGTATQLAHRTEVPLLIARRTADDYAAFPSEVLLASDGSQGSWAALRLAAELTRARESELKIVYVPDGHPERYRELFKQVEAVERLTGAAPGFVDVAGDPSRRIAEAARAAQSSLIVIGKRGTHGRGSLGSVSERVVHRAPCSVLVVPPPAGRRRGAG